MSLKYELKTEVFIKKSVATHVCVYNHMHHKIEKD